MPVTAVNMLVGSIAEGDREGVGGGELPGFGWDEMDATISGAIRCVSYTSWDRGGSIIQIPGNFLMWPSEKKQFQTIKTQKNSC